MVAAMLGLTLLLIVSSVWKSDALVEKQHFKTWKGYKLYNGILIKTFSFKNMSIARCASFCTGDCKSATFSRTLNQCVTFKDSVYGSSIKRISDAQWYTIYKNKPVQFGNWTLVFKAQRDINQSLYDLWTSTGTSDDNPLSVDFPVECLQLTYSNTCKRHFRSSILDQWVNIDMVKFSLYFNGAEVKYILFDGRNTTWTSWFTISNIIYTTWRNMIIDPLVSEFSITGRDDGFNKRRFAINGGYGGCHLDQAYFFAIDTLQESCIGWWPMDITSFPKLIYSPYDFIVPMLTIPLASPAYGYADFMAIFVTFMPT